MQPSARYCLVLNIVRAVTSTTDVRTPHRPTRQRERRMQGFKSPGHAQRFLSAYSPISQYFRLRRHLLRAGEYRRIIVERFEEWREVAGLVTAE
jgi:hypothetical protein